MYDRESGSYPTSSSVDPLVYGSGHRSTVKSNVPGVDYDSREDRIYDSSNPSVMDKRVGYASTDIYHDRESRLLDDRRERYPSSRTNVVVGDRVFGSTAEPYSATHHLSSHHVHPMHSTAVVPSRFGFQGNYPSHQRNENKMLVNVGGHRHEILWTTLEKFPSTRLGRLHEARTEDAILQFCDFYSYEDNEYFFDKNPVIFSSVLSCYRNGKLHIPDEFCLSEIVTELRYWGFDESFLDMCCQQKYRTRKMLYQEMKAEAETELFQLYGYQPNQMAMGGGMQGYPGYGVYDDRWGIGACARYRKFFYDSFENPRIARMTQILPVISIIANVLGVISVILNSVDSFRDKDKFGEKHDNKILTNVTMGCFGWISIEYILRMWASPSVKDFSFDVCNIIDLLGCGLYFYTVLQPMKPDKFSDYWKIFLMLRSWRVPNLICKLVYDPSFLRMDTAILTNFNKQFAVLMLFFVTVVVMFSTVIYTAEKDDPKCMFTSIPEVFWYTIATLTTVGNSSAIPVTVWGKYFGSLGSIVGVIFIATVITVSNFARVLQARISPFPSTMGLGPQQQQQGLSGIMPASDVMGFRGGMPYSMVVNPPPGISTNAPGIQHLPPASSHLPQQQQHYRPPGSTTTTAGQQTNIDDRSSFHHITFNDDLLNALGTIDVLVERDKKTSRLEPPAFASNKVKTITLKIKLDPIPRPTQHTGMAAAGIPGVTTTTGLGNSKLHSTTTGMTTMPTTGGLASFFGSSTQTSKGPALV